MQMNTQVLNLLFLSVLNSLRNLHGESVDIILIRGDLNAHFLSITPPPPLLPLGSLLIYLSISVTAMSSFKLDAQNVICIQYNKKPLSVFKHNWEIVINK